MRNASAPLSRETLAGYDRARLERAVVVLVGAGALGNNVAQNMALAGIGEIRAIDPDTVDPSNVTRSPFLRLPSSSSKPRYKAREVARRALATSYATTPRAGFAIARVEALGAGAFQRASVIVSCVDSHRVRAYLADVARTLGIPLVEGGFRGFVANITCWPNRTAEEPCWRCLVPNAATSGISCTTYARAVEETGGTPATQTVAATLGGLVTEAAIGAIHGEFPLAGKLLSLEIREGRSHAVAVTADPTCPGAHRRFEKPLALIARADAALASVLTELGSLLGTPRILLPAPFVVRMPCARCGADLVVHAPAWTVGAAPVCAPECPAGVSRDGQGIEIVHAIAAESPVAHMNARRLGLPPGAVFEVEDADSGAIVVCQLAGGPADLFVTLEREARHTTLGPPTEDIEGNVEPSKGYRP